MSYLDSQVTTLEAMRQTSSEFLLKTTQNNMTLGLDPIVVCINQSQNWICHVYSLKQTLKMINVHDFVSSTWDLGHKWINA